MPLMTWSDSWNVNVKSIDDQHKVLVSLINKLHDAMTTGQGQKILAGVLDELADYTRKHFFHEESLMWRAGYPETAQHARIHADMIAKVNELQEKTRTGKALTLEVMTFLKDWLAKHIQGTDMKYSACLTGAKAS